MMMTLPDYFLRGLRVVIVGTAVGECSARRGHYYAGRGNDFWRLLHESGMTPRRLASEDDASLPNYGIGVTDLVKNVAQFHDRGPAYNVPAFLDKVERHQPAWVAFHGKRAAIAYAKSARYCPPGLGPTGWRVAGSRAFVLPSASGANRRAEYDGRPTRVEWWADLQGLLDEQVA
jgi:double-stranded uracil-DNA glycosylase